MDEYDLDTTNLAGLADHRDRLIALAEQCGQHEIVVSLSMPTHLTESDLDELEGPISPLLFPLYGVASRFSGGDQGARRVLRTHGRRRWACRRDA